MLKLNIELNKLKSNKNLEPINFMPFGDKNTLIALSNFYHLTPVIIKLKAEGRWEELQKLPKNSSPVRMHNRCKLTGRPRGYMRQFGISRVTFREMANKGLIPGVSKASW